MAKKTKNVSDFSHRASKIYDGVARGIASKAQPVHAKRLIDQELDKHVLSTDKIKYEIRKAVEPAVESATADLNKAIQSKDELNATLTTDIGVIRDENTGLKDDISSLRTIGDELTENLKTSSESLITLKEDHKTVVTDLGKAQDKAIEKLNDEVVDFKAVHKKETDKLSGIIADNQKEYEAKVKEFGKEIDGYKTRIADLEK